jgi:hypothetical protein
MKVITPKSAVAHLTGVMSLLAVLGGCQNVQPVGGNPAADRQNSMNSGFAADTQGEGELDVRLEAVGRSRPEAFVRARNPFRFGQGLRDSGVGGGASAPDPAGEMPALRTLPRAPTSPRAQIRMIGLIEGAGTVGRVAVLTDGEHVFHGRAGEIVEGRYRVVVVGPDSVQLESVHDGQQQTLRLAAM